MQLTRPRPAAEDVARNGSAPSLRSPRGGWMRRAAVLAGRLLLWTAILVLAVRGGVATVGELRSPASPTAVAPTDEAAPPFPAAAAQALATRFAQDYLTYDAADDAGRADRLAAYGLVGRGGEVGWDGRGEQTVHAAVAVDVAVAGPTQAAVVVAAQVSGPRWLHLSVPVVADAAGRVGVAGSPTLVAPPPMAAVSPPREPPADTALSRELEPVLQSFLEAYAAGRADDLAYYLPVGREMSGLDGAVELDELVDLQVAEGGTARTALATVRWRDTVTEAGLTQRYELRLVDRDGRWYVDGFGPQGASMDDGRVDGQDARGQGGPDDR